jgi:hypothetical protein
MPASAFSRCFAALIAAVLLLCSARAAAQVDFVDPNLHWRTLQTEHFAVHYAEAQRTEARMAAAVAEKLWPRITRVLRWEPADRTHIIVLDSADFSNGFATPLPFNISGIFLSPPDDGELLQNREWLEMVLSHELFHIVHLDKARGAPLALRSVFGRFPLLFPNVLQPTWVIEGRAGLWPAGEHALRGHDARGGGAGPALARRAQCRRPGLSAEPQLPLRQLFLRVHARALRRARGDRLRRELQ